MSQAQEFRHILVIEDRKGRRIVSLEDSNYTIGRDSNNQIVLYDYQVSRTHATLIRKIQEDSHHFSYSIIDGDIRGNKSTNGLSINGHSTISHELKHGDSIYFASETKANYYIISTDSAIDLFFKPEGLEQISASRATLENQSTDTMIAKDEHDENSEEQQELIRLASFPELSPNPIIELDWNGNLTYVNPAASFKFETIHEDKLNHPILKGLLSEDSNRQGNLFLREVKIGSEVFEQYVHYLSEKKLIRSYIFDFTKRKQVEAQLRESQARYQTIVGQTSEGILLAYASTRRIVEANPPLLKLLGYSHEEITNLTLYNILADDLTSINNDLTLLLERKEDSVGKYLFRLQDGSLVNLEASVSLTRYQNKDIFCFVVYNCHASEEQEFSDYLTYHDGVTHLPNQKFFQEQLNIAITKAENYQHLMGLMAIEIDNWAQFSQNNEQPSNHQLLKNLSQIIRSSITTGELLARWDESIFMILFPYIKGPQNPAKIAKKISTTLNQFLEKQSTGSDLELKAYLSLMIYPIDGNNSSLLIKNTLLSLEQCQGSKNSNYEVTGFNLTSKSASLLRIENLIASAIKDKQFFLSYQPQIDINSKQITGLEALLRWAHPELAKLKARHFLRLTEETDFMSPLETWILQTATQQMQNWRQEEITPFPIAINISTKQLNQANFVPTVVKILEQTGLPPELLELELRENSFFNNAESVYQTLEKLSALKIRLSLDNFGADNSALIHLQKAPFNTVKISSNIINTIEEDQKNQALVKSMSVLCEGYNSRLVALGVERLEQMELLKELGCTEIQGNLLSPPLPVKEANLFVRKSEDHTLS